VYLRRLFHCFAEKHRYMYTILLLYAFLVPLFVVPVGDFWGWSDIFLPIGLAVALWNLKKITPGVVAATALLIAAMVSIFQVFGDTHETIISAIKVARLAGIILPIYLVASTHLTSLQVHRLAWVSWWGTALALSVSLALYSMGVQLREHQQLMYSELTGELIYRNGGLVGDSGVCGHVASFHFMVGFYLAFVSHERFRMPASAFFFLVTTTIGLSTASILTSSSRSALLAMFSFLACYLLIVFFLSLRRMPISAIWQGALIGFVLTTTIIATISFGSNDKLFESLVDRMSFSNADSLEVASSGRIATWSEISQRIVDDVLFGVGYKQGMIALGNRAVDNIFLLVIFECGLLGIVALMLAAYAFWVAVFRLQSYGLNTSVFLFSLGLSQIVHGMTVDNLTMWSSAPLFFLLGAAISSLGFLHTESLANEPQFEGYELRQRELLEPKGA